MALGSWGKVNGGTTKTKCMALGAGTTDGEGSRRDSVAEDSGKVVVRVHLPLTGRCCVRGWGVG